MQEIDIALAADIRDVERHIERAIASIPQLRVASRGTLKTRPGSIHWHLKFARDLGTLELTYWPAEQRLWFKIHPRRRADWMEDVVQRLSRAITVGK